MGLMESIRCSLCQGTTKPFFQGRHGEYFHCEQCWGVFLSPKYFSPPEIEKARYETHNNDIKDARYQKFVSPIVNQVLADFSPQDQGLDFGCGTGPVIHYLLQQEGYLVTQYDPFFWNQPEALKQSYDYIICCEVIEHFHNPRQEFSQLYSLLNLGGRLYCMTELLTEEIDFKDWSYKDDFTHVFFYHPETIQWIKQEYGFRKADIKGRLIILEK